MSFNIVYRIPQCYVVLNKSLMCSSLESYYVTQQRTLHTALFSITSHVQCMCGVEGNACGFVWNSADGWPSDTCLLMGSVDTVYCGSGRETPFLPSLCPLQKMEQDDESQRVICDVYSLSLSHNTVSE